MPDRPLIVLCGPTASGKSALAIRLAERYNLLLISADSRQIYRDFDIGTAKPTAAEQAHWPHHLINVADPGDTYTVAQYQQAVTTLINAHPNQVPLLVGGTGLYIQAITEGLQIPAIPPHPALRDQLSQLGQAHAYALLNAAEPEHKIHANDAVRTLRALEILYVTGQPPSALKARATEPPYQSLIVGLQPASMAILETRIRQRTQAMLAQGWIEEVQQLQAHYGADLPLLQTLGYGELGRYLQGELSLLAATELIVCHTRQFAKRQMTWFRRTPNLRWFDMSAPDLEARLCQQIEMVLSDGGGTTSAKLLWLCPAQAGLHKLPQHIQRSGQNNRLRLSRQGQLCKGDNGCNMGKLRLVRDRDLTQRLGWHRLMLGNG
ncbi:MAG: tRNA (adenosine(37)-N6)-dimethylallyltransferase MiaA [Synechococcaceae cyanobacterium SM2_3_60]|nr:tRNA (adenosine(37)-N6)-dimethylallyltransferase MiaA [Synechococcaceae cyanobacterium SM2_3_60]